MDRILATSDIHGCYDEFNELLKKANYNADKDQLILLGDYVDRGPFSNKVIDQVIGLVKNGAIAIRGNHDQMFLDALKGSNDEVFIHNGGVNTIESYINDTLLNSEMYTKAKWHIGNTYNHHVDFLDTLPFYYESTDHIFVHAGLHPFYNDFDWKMQDMDNLLWIRELFLNNPTNLSKVVIHGHTPTFGNVIFSEDKINIDGGGVFGGHFNLLSITDSGYTEYTLKGKRYP